MKKILEPQMVGAEVKQLGEVVSRKNLLSSVGAINYLTDYRVKYPRSVIEALGQMYREYNQAFISAVELNREWKTDYQYCLQMKGSLSSPVNFAVQIDMVGLPDGFLRAAANMSVEEVREVLRGKIYEIENSLAMYQLLERSFADNLNQSFFNTQFRVTLDKLRKRFRKPIALLAVTEQKYTAMKATEFGEMNGRAVADADVYELSGFDRFFGPQDFREYVDANNGRCDYLLYARTSDPVEKLKNPRTTVVHQLLGDPEMRRIIKANALTFNIDAPEMDSVRRINDTKLYMSQMGLAFQIQTEAELFSPDFAEHLFAGRSYAKFSGSRLSRGFSNFLKEQGIDPTRIENGEIALRGKPLKGAYGCYGHVSGFLTESKFRSVLRRGLSQRDGGYVIQVEMATPVITNTSDGKSYNFIDRNFFSFLGKNAHFMGGFRSLMPTDSSEAKHGRNHGNAASVWVEITA